MNKGSSFWSFLTVVLGIYLILFFVNNNLFYIKFIDDLNHELYGNQFNSNLKPRKNNDKYDYNNNKAERTEEKPQDDARVNWEGAENTSRTEGTYEETEDRQIEKSKLPICEWCDNEIKGKVYYTEGKKVRNYNPYPGSFQDDIKRYHQRCANEKVQLE